MMGYLACARTVPCTHPSSSSCAPSHTQGGGSRPMSARWLGALQLWHCGLADRVDARVDPSRVSSARYASGGVNRATANDLPISYAAGSLLSCTYPAVVKTTCEHPVAVPRRRARSLVWTANSPRRSGGVCLVWVLPRSRTSPRPVRPPTTSCGSHCRERGASPAWPDVQTGCAQRTKARGRL